MADERTERVMGGHGQVRVSKQELEELRAAAESSGAAVGAVPSPLDLKKLANTIVHNHGSVECHGVLFAEKPYCDTLLDDVPLCEACQKLADEIHEALQLAAASRVARPPDVDLPADAAKVLRENLWNLYDGEPARVARPEPDANLLSAEEWDTLELALWGKVGNTLEVNHAQRINAAVLSIVNQRLAAARVARGDASAWQPIATLPIVGIFLFARAGSRSVIMGWNDSRQPYGIQTEKGALWFRPTHWMPLPEPPRSPDAPPLADPPDPE